MATDHCDGCRHDVPAGRWCNRCGAPLAPPAGPRRVGPPAARWLAGLAALATVVVATVGALAVGGGGPDVPPRPPDDTEVVLDGAVAGPVPDRSAERSTPVTVERPGGSPTYPARGCSPAPGGRELRTNLDCSERQAHTDVVCSDLRVRSVPSGQLVTTREGDLVELAHGTCVVMGSEGAAGP